MPVRVGFAGFGRCTNKVWGMLIERSAQQIVVRTPAKLNLWFEVLGRREDGYHEIETLMCPISLFDTLYFKEEPGGQIELTCERVSGSAGENFPVPAEVPEGPKNLVVRAVELYRRRAGTDSGARLRLVKRIPVAAGLGGGSSDAAAALVAADLAWGRLPRHELYALAAEIGSDVPFFLAGGPAICRGRGERVEPVVSARRWHFVVLCPPAGLATAEVYRACGPARLPVSSAPMCRAFARGDLATVGRLLFNRLEPAAARLSKWVTRLKEELAESELAGCAMTGSGSSCFGLCRHRRQARRIAERFRARDIGNVFAVASWP